MRALSRGGPYPRRQLLRCGQDGGGFQQRSAIHRRLQYNSQPEGRRSTPTMTIIPIGGVPASRRDKN
jgi:hypothetical protein